ncbi:hypothetical protein PMZ80_007855 [Knufia obscura]|uniref:FAD-binding domain-containing protein n=2 Tax=Knufia TaxID=430999 RepID=A0AAN8EFI1_9EURO|nr:hypothetical protein PMZ80_007855 [Knufia obscura]KAK5949497.1 hypothetical protein OHC33_009490 [Knufia fluminis]
MIHKSWQQQRLSKTKADVVVVGAGPVGLLIALCLGKAGIDTLVIEAHHELLPTTRAVVYMPVVLPVLKALGILEKVLDAAFLNKDGVRWRDIDGRELAHLPLGGDGSGEDGGVLLIGQWRMNELILEELDKYPCVEVQFGMRCVGIEDKPESEHVRIMTHSGSMLDDDTFLEAKYMVATDGANSTVRRMMCVPFEGFTFQEFKMIGTDVIYDFIAQEGFTPLNFVVHPKDWAVIAYTGQEEDGLPIGSGKPQWRVAYVEDPDLPASKEDYLKRAEEQIKKYVTKGDGKFRVIRAEPYLMQQRVAAQPRKGRVVLAGDALHSNNPIGGLGLTGGILDAYCYGNALTRVLKEAEHDNLLTTCALARRNAWRDVTDKLSQDNMKRLYAEDPKLVAQREEFFCKLNDGQAGKDFGAAVGKAFGKMMLEDFSRLAI